jgi:hypothetical protein
MFAICRVKKLKTAANITSAALHNFRAPGAAPNADLKNSDQNVYKGSRDPLKKIEAIHTKLGVKARKDSVLANEYVLTASPEFFENMDKKAIKDWADDNIKWLKKRHGIGLVSVAIHMDETTPHIHAIVTPVYEKENGKWGLSAKRFFDKPKLRELQTEYAQRMEKFGLERGIKGSKAKHETVQKYYGDLEEQLEKAGQNGRELEELLSKESEDSPSFFNFKKRFDKLVQFAQKIVKKLDELEKLHGSKIMKLERQNQRLESQMMIYKKLGAQEHGPDFTTKRFGEILLAKDEQIAEQKQAFDDQIKGLESDNATLRMENRSAYYELGKLRDKYEPKEPEYQPQVVARRNVDNDSSPSP